VWRYRRRDVLQAALNRGALALIGLLVTTIPARASAASVDYDAPASCPTEAEARSSWSGIATARATIVIREEPRGYRGVATRGEYQRELHDPSCRALVEALALVLSMDAAEAAERPAPRALVPTPPKPAPRVRAFVGGRIEGILGLQPGLAPALSLVAGAARGPWRLAGYGLATAPLRGGGSDGSSTIAREAVFQSLAAGALACGVLGTRVAAGLCAGAEVGVVRGAGRAVDETRRGSAWFFAPVLALHGEAFVSRRLALTADLALAAPVHRATFRVANEPVHRAGIANARVALGVTWWP